MLQVTNPATGQAICDIKVTEASELPKYFERARFAQRDWAKLPLKKRIRILYLLRESMLNHIDELAHLISQENGKPVFEALANEILPSIHSLTYYCRLAPSVLRNEKIPSSMIFYRPGYLNFWPMGVIGIISPWNYPLLLPFCEIIMALLAGNAVIFKPSEVTPLIALKLEELALASGLPTGLLQVIIGDGSLGSALIQNKPDKLYFTGSVPTGIKIAQACAQYLIPVNLELGGKDPFIVLADADLDFATSAAVWGAFSNSGQVCASTERILVHESLVVPFKKLLMEKAKTLRQGDPALGNVDLGVTTFNPQKDVYRRHLAQAVSGNAEILGGKFNESQTALEPTLVCGSNIETLDVYNEESFGPIAALTTFRSVDELVQKANSSRYALTASIISRNSSLAEEIAKRLEFGTVLINETTYTAGIPEAPWGGPKETGLGRSHMSQGLRDFTHMRYIQKPISRIFVYKSLWWFPYTPFQYATFKHFLGLYRRSWLDKLKAIPNILWNFVQMIKDEPRL